MQIKSAELDNFASTQNKDEIENKTACLKSVMSLRNLRYRRLQSEKAKATIDINANIVGKADNEECFYCGQQARGSCQFCDGIFFCSQEHLNIHRPAVYCHPFIVKRDPDFGRYTIASRDIQPSELILREKPAANGPYTRTAPVCSGHACYNNTSYVKSDDLHLQLRAHVAIKAGAEITTRFLSSTLGNCRRKTDLSRYWYFDCRCVQCIDSTEMGTQMSSVRCICGEGLCVNRNALDCDSDWVCKACQRTVPWEEIVREVDSIEEELAKVDMTDTDKLEELIAGHCSHPLLHPQHFLVIQLMHSLAIAYSNKDRLARPLQERKVQLCSQVLEVLGTVDPGFTFWRGKLLQEMACTLLLISRADYAVGSITETLFKRRRYFCMRALATAKKCHSNLQ